MVRAACAPMSSSAPRASARAEPMSPVGTSRAARRSASDAIDEARCLQRVDHRVDLPLRVAHPFVELLIEPLAERLFAIAQLLLARVQPRLRLLHHLAFARDEAALVIEALHLALHLGQVLGELRLACRPLRPRLSMMLAGSPRRVEISSARLLPGRSVMQPVGRRERLRVEAEAARRHRLGIRRVGLQRVEVRRGDDQRAALAEVIDDRRRQRAPFVRIGAAARLVEQHQRRQGERLVHRHDVGDVRRERAEALGDRLLVADVGEHAVQAPAPAILPPPGSAGRPAPSPAAVLRSSAPRSCRRCSGR